ncbi:hypothetical protein BDZ45DRAFT_694707 [Acephala macrosclerotiorum]|nr:hypothetical protein BDZ45DRAFT_694707 [Acephala macrosclerotiorum]
MATRVAVRLTHYDPTNLEDAAFQRYFVTDGRVSGQWSSGPNRGHYLNLINNLKQVGLFPSTGDSKGRILQKWRIGYLCGKIPEERDHCIDSSGNPSGVYVIPVFHTTKPVQLIVSILQERIYGSRVDDMVTAGPRKEVIDLNDPDIYTFERTIMHKWMHCKNPIGMAKKGKSTTVAEHVKFQLLIGIIVIDLDAGNPNKAVYGSQRCHDRAWLSIPAPNPEIVLNGSSYPMKIFGPIS